MKHRNAFIFPVVYFFYPETAYRSLEEMDTIFRKTTTIFNAVWTAKKEPHRFGKNGEVLLSYDETGEHARRESIAAERRATLASQGERRRSSQRRSSWFSRSSSHGGNPSYGGSTVADGNRKDGFDHVDKSNEKA